MKLKDVRAGDRVTILVPAGISREGQEWKPKTGRAVMPGSVPDSWVLDMGGAHGTPGVATPNNFVRAVRNSSARAKAAGWQNRRFP